MTTAMKTTTAVKTTTTVKTTTIVKMTKSKRISDKSNNISRAGKGDETFKHSNSEEISVGQTISTKSSIDNEVNKSMRSNATNKKVM